MITCWFIDQLREIIRSLPSSFFCGDQNEDTVIASAVILHEAIVSDSEISSFLEFTLSGRIWRRTSFGTRIEKFDLGKQKQGDQPRPGHVETLDQPNASVNIDGFTHSLIEQSFDRVLLDLYPRFSKHTVYGSSISSLFNWPLFASRIVFIVPRHAQRTKQNVTGTCSRLYLMSFT